MNRRPFIYSFAIIILVLSMLESADQPTSTGPLTLEQRVAYQRAIEQVYWQHRIWPKENKGAKPPLAQIMPDAVIRAKVQDYLKKSNALAEYWQRPVTAEHLQAEMDRMINNTNRPDMLRELFAALRNNPQVIAECLARPVLVDRLIQNLYASDERFHAALKQQIEDELRGATVQSIRALSGRYSEVEAAKATQTDFSARAGRILNLSESEWNERLANLEQLFGQKSIPMEMLSGLQQDADRFYIVTVLEKENNRMKTATVEWAKKSFEEWWSEQKNRLNTNIVEEPYLYNFSPAPKTPTCSGDSWTTTNTSNAPVARDLHTAVWTGSEMIIWGGYDANNLIISSGGRYDPSTDSWAATSGSNEPEARLYHTAVWSGTEMIVWGGSGSAYLSSGGRYNPSNDSWTETSSSDVPTARGNHTAVWTGTEMIVWGGDSDFGLLGSGGRYNPFNDSWTETSTSNAPGVRSGHTAVWTDSEMIIWGGVDVFLNPLSSGSRYNPSNDSWTATSSTDVPAARTRHTAVWVGSMMVIWGGSDPSSFNAFSTGGRYDPSTDSWTATSSTNAAEARHSNTAVWTGTEMIVWGGLSPNFGFLSTGGRYDPSGDSWTATSIINAPSSRVRHTAVWTGTEMIVWGGQESGPKANTGGRYGFVFAVPAVSIGDASVAEGNAGTVDLNFTVTLDVCTNQDVTVDFETADDTATDSDNDYEPQINNITILADQTQGTISIPINGDTKSEANETFFVNLTSATNATISDGQGVGTIYNEDGIVLSIQDTSVSEKFDRTVYATFTVVVTPPSGAEITVEYSTADGSAQASSGDYTVTSGTLTIPALSTESIIDVPILPDGLNEGGETFFINLSNPSGATIGDEQAIGTIHDSPEEWLQRSGGEFQDFPAAMVIDGDGNVYVTGKSRSDLNTNDFLTMKYDANGNPSTTWPDVGYGVGARRLDDGPDDTALAVAVNPNGIYVTGPSMRNHEYGYLTAGYDSAGNLIFSIRYDGGTNGYDSPSAIATDTSGHIYVTGNSDGISCDFATIKYDANGTPSSTWPDVGAGVGVRRYNGPANGCDYANAMVVDASGNIYVTGATDSFGFYDYATVKYDSAGNQVFVANYNGPANLNDEPRAITLDASGNIYVTGFSHGSNFSFDYATIKYDPNGNPSPTWGDTGFGIGVLRYDHGGDDAAGKIALDANANVYVTGLSGDPNTGNDYTTIKYDSNGNPSTSWLDTGSGIGVRRYNGPSSLNDFPTGMVVDSTGRVAVTGVSNAADCSFPFVNGSDYATVKYDADGNLSATWPDAGHGAGVRLYNGPDNGCDGARAIANDSSDNIYVAGDSYSNATDYDFVTIKYRNSGTAPVDTDGDGVPDESDNCPNDANADQADYDQDGVGNVCDPTPYVLATINDLSIAEGNSGNSQMQFMVTLSGPSSVDVSFNYETSDGTAQDADNDYELATNALTIPAGQTQGSISITMNGDTVFEANETFFVNLTGASNATIVDGQGLGTISNDDVPPTLSIQDTAVYEKIDRTAFAKFTVVVTPPSGAEITVQYSTADGSAQASSDDYTVTSGTLTIPALSTESIIDVPILQDGLNEGDETLFMNLSNPAGATISDGQAIGTIHDSPEEWVRRSGSEFEDRPVAMVIDGDGNVYVTGYSYNDLNSSDFLTMKYDANGNPSTTWPDVGYGVGARRLDGGIGGQDVGRAVTVDPNGNVYVTGRSQINVIDYDYLTASYDSAGNLIFSIRYDGNTIDEPTAIATDASGHIYVTGQTIAADVSCDFATIKYDADGTPSSTWPDVGAGVGVRRYNGPDSDCDHAIAMVVDAPGNVYVTGASAGSSSNYDYATVKYDSAGNQLFVAKYNGPANSADIPEAITLDASGNIYVTGQSRGSNFDFDYATIKYNSNGNPSPTWADTGFGIGVRRYDHGSDDGAHKIAVDANANVYITGYSWDPNTMSDYTTIKYDANGDPSTSWPDTGSGVGVRRYNGPNSLNDGPTGLAVDSAGRIAVTGFSDVANCTDYATVKYDPNGNLSATWPDAGNGIGVRRYNGVDNSCDEARAIAVDSSDNIHVAGNSFSNATDSDFVTIKYRNTTDPTADTDGDGVPDANDNCPLVANANQADADGDGIGDACDSCPADPSNDADGDGVCGNVDNCPNAANADQADYDQDGVGNGCDPTPYVLATISDVSETEGNSGNGQMQFTVTLSGPSSVDVSFNYQTSDGTAQNADNDYEPATNALTIPAAQTQGSINITMNGDTVFEANETFFVNLTGATNATINDGQGVGTINNDDDPPTLSIQDTSVFEKIDRTAFAKFTVVVTPPSSAEITVQYSAADGSAQAASGDYTVTSGTLTIPAGSTGTITVPILQDGLNEGDETFFINLSNPVGATIGDAQAICTIHDSTEEWLRRSGAEFGDRAFAMVIDGDGNVYVAGDSYTSDTTSDFLTIKYDSTGTPSSTWPDVGYGFGARRLDAGIEDQAHAVTTDANGNVYVTGFAYIDVGDYDYLTAGYDAAGNLIFAVRYDGGISRNDTPRAIATDASGHIYVTGVTGNSDGICDFATIKYDSDGTPSSTWRDVGAGVGVRRYHGPFVNSCDQATAMAVNSASEFVYVTGPSAGSPDKYDYATVLYDSAGNEVLVARYDGPGNGFDQPNAITLDASGNVYVTGFSLDSNEFDYDYATIKYDSNLNPSFTWADIGFGMGVRRYDRGLELSGRSDDRAIDIGLDASANVYVTGHSWGGTTNYDYITIKYDSNGNPSTSWPDSGAGIGVRLYNGPDSLDDYPTGMIVDSAGRVALTGSSGVANCSDYATVKYDPDGNLSITWPDAGDGSGVRRYNGPDNGCDEARVIAVDSSDNIYVAGNSYSNATDYDFVTIKYRNSTTPPADTDGDGVPDASDNCPNDANADQADYDQDGVGNVCDPTPYVLATINDVSMAERNSGSSQMQFTVTLSGPSSVDVSFNYETSDGTAQDADNDYEPATNALTISAGQTQGSISITINGDTNFEADETFTVTLSGATNVTISDGSGLGTILNDDSSTPTLSVNDVTITEGNSGTVNATFTITQSSPSATNTSVKFTTSDGTAKKSTDYVSKSLRVTIPAGSTSAQVDVAVNGDQLFEVSETFKVKLTNPIGATIADNLGIGTILNDDAPPALSINDVVVTETEANQTVIFTVSLSQVSGAPTKVMLSTQDGTAVAPSDYGRKTNAGLTIPAGTLSKTFNVTVTGNAIAEPQENFFVNLSNPTNATITDGQGVCTINDND